MGGTPFQLANGGIVVASRSAGTWDQITGLPASIGRPSAVVRDPQNPHGLFAATNDAPGSVQVYHIELQGQAVLRTKALLPTALREFEAVGLAAVGDELFLMTRHALHRLSRFGGADQVIFPFPAQTAGRAFATDGRRLFASISTRDIYVLDLLQPTLVSLFATLPGSLSAIQDLSLDDRGNLLVADSDPWNGSTLRLMNTTSGVEMRSTSVRLDPPLAIAHDALLDEDFVAGVWSGQPYMATFNAGREVQRIGPLPYLPGSLQLVRTLPLYLSGSGCASSAGHVPFYDATNLPVQGRVNFGLHIYNAPSGPAVLFVGGRSPGTPVFALPLDGLGLNCALEVMPDLALPAVIAAGGEGTLFFSVPVDPSIGGAIVDTQWWVFDPGANALGLAASQRGTVILE